MIIATVLYLLVLVYKPRLSFERGSASLTAARINLDTYACTGNAGRVWGQKVGMYKDVMDGLWERNICRKSDGINHVKR